MSEQPAFGAADLTNCDREPIRIPGSIQPHGAILAMEPDSLIIVHAGGALAEVLGAEAQDMLGRKLGAFLPAAQVAHLTSLATSAMHMSRPVPVFTVHHDGQSADAIAHFSTGLMVLELEPRRESEPEDSLALVQAMARKVMHAGTVAQSYQEIVDGVHGASGFDRVMLYRFLPDGSGAVEAEARNPGIESYLGLRYPASDIPQQARALYLSNWVRLIPDARYTPAPILTARDEDGRAPLDLSLGVLRSVSPIHLEYLANMGVTASMSLSIVIDGKLWGLVACHHYTPRFLSHRLRVAFELFSQMASFQLEAKIEAESLDARLHGSAINAELVATLGHETEFAEGLRRFQPRLLEIIPASGVVLWIDGGFSRLGRTPNEKAVKGLVKWLNANISEGVFCTDRLVSHYPSAKAFADVGSGILALSISRSPRDYLIWFRPELVHTVHWAGDPNKAMTAGARLSPRTSFAAWQQQVELQSEAWSGLDIRIAQSLRVSLLEIALAHIDQLARERQRARVQQDALLAQLDQRIVEWEKIAKQLKVESDRRAVVETELSQVLRRTVIDQEAERQRIARELHDSLGQYLTVMRLDLDAIGREPEAQEPIRRRVEKLKELTTALGQEVNQLAWEIRPTALDDLGLQTAFQQFLEEWGERSALKFDLQLMLDDRRLPAATETALYRVLQEAILNVIKHAEASRVGVILEAAAGQVTLIVEDDGKGFIWNEARGADGAADRLGLLGIRERLALVGGTMEVETAPGSGTTLIIHVPL